MLKMNQNKKPERYLSGDMMTAVGKRSKKYCLSEEFAMPVEKVNNIHHSVFDVT